MDSRTATLRLAYSGKDISRDIAPYVLGFTYTDNAHGQADDLQIQLEDRDHLWKGDWLPGKGDTISASIRCLAWESPEAAPRDLPCGTFQVDEIELSVSRDGGDTVTLKGVSSLTKNSIRQEAKTRAWENSSLQRVFGDIAQEHGFQLSYQAEGIAFTRLDQRGETDLAFMNRVVEDYGLNLKISDITIIVFAGKDYDAKPAGLTLARGASAIRQATLRTKTVDTYQACEVSYHDPATKSVQSYTYTDPDASATGRTLRVNEVAEDIAMAERKAKAALRRKNKQAVEGDITLMGNPLLAGMNVQLSGFKRFDGVYAVEQARHSYSRSSGYTTAINVRKVLSW